MVGTVIDDSVRSPLPRVVGQFAARYLHLADRALSKRIEVLHLIGSFALGDYQSRCRDIGFVAIT